MVNTGTNKKSDSNVLDMALQFARRGWLVFPLAGKIPFSKTHGHKDATCDEEEIKAFWEKYPNANIGIATGRRSGIFVVDIDTKMGKRGDESLLELEEEYGSLPSTVECITASRGRHLYFRYPRDVEIYNSQSKIGEDIDVRGEGGYVVAPGSIVDGNSYEWEASGHPDDVVIAYAPEWLIQLATENSQNERFKLPEGIIPYGQQDDILFRLACSLRAQGLSKELVEIALRQALTKCQQDPDNPFTSKDIERWIKSAFSYPDNNHSDKTIQFFNDVWNADKFVEQHGNIIRNCEQLGGWFIWNGKVWEKDETHLITQLARQTVQSFSSMALQMTTGSKEQKAFLQHMKTSGNENKLGAMVHLAKSNKGISVLTDEFDANPYLLNCQNGIVDLKKGCLIDHDPNCLISKICNTHFDPNAECPQWDKFLHKIFIGNHQLISFMQKIIGYSLTADVSMQMFFILYGGGNNGKSTLVETIHKIVGDYSLVTPTSTLMVKKGSEVPNDVARLKGARFVISSELESSKPLDEALVKKCTSNEPIPARFLHKEFFEFSPSAKIFLSTNYKPTIKGMDDGIWRRLRLIPFEYKFEESEKNDHFAEQFLYPEMPGILRWAVEGYQKLIKEGLKEPDIVRYATAAYKSSEDIVGAYLQEFCVIEPYCKVLVLELYDHFKENAGCYMSRKNFNEYLVKRGFVNDQGSAGRFKGRMTWYGIGLRAEVNQEEDAPRPF